MSSEDTEDEDDIPRVVGYSNYGMSSSAGGSNQILLPPQFNQSKTNLYSSSNTPIPINEFSYPVYSDGAQNSDSYSYQFGTSNTSKNPSISEKSQRDKDFSYTFSSDLPKKNLSISHQTREKTQTTQSDKSKFSTSIVSEDTSATMPPIFLDHEKIMFIKKIGGGGFGEVWLGKLSGSLIVIKTLLDTKITSEQEEAFKKEAEIMESLRNPNIVFYYGFCIQDKKSCIVMEYMQNGSLNSLLKKKKIEEISWRERYIIAKDITEGLSYLHGAKILHRDLKSPNVLLTHEYRGKLADFGLAYQQIKTGTLSKTLELKESSRSGTLHWMAPELFSLSPVYSKASDIYAYGVILWEMATHKIPYPSVPPIILQASILRGERAEIPESIPEETYAKMIEQCWTQNPKERPTTQVLSEILEKLIIKSSSSKKIISNTILLDKNSQKKDATFHQDRSLPVEEKELPELPKRFPVKRKKEKWIAICDYETKDEGYLSFKNGETINILEKSGNWWLGELKGNVGKVPSNHLQKNSGTHTHYHSLKPLPPLSPTKGKGLFDRQAPRIDIVSSPKEKSNDEISPKPEKSPKNTPSIKPSLKLLNKNRIFSDSKKKDRPPSLPLNEPSLDEKTTSQKKAKKLLSQSNTKPIEDTDQSYSVNEYIKQAQQALSQDNKPIAIECLTHAVQQYAKEWFKINSKVIFSDKITNPKLINADIAKRIKYCDPTLQEISVKENEWTPKLRKGLLKNPHIWNLRFNSNPNLINNQLHTFLNKNSALCKLDDLNKKHVINITVMGGPFCCVGKTPLIERFVSGIYDERYNPTYDIDQYNKYIEVHAQKYLLKINDISSYFPNDQDICIKESDAFILVYSIKDESSFLMMPEVYYNIHKIKDVARVPIVLSGSMSDLSEKRTISIKQGEELAGKFSAPYIEVSAKKNINVDKLFYDIVKLHLEYTDCLYKHTRKFLNDNRELNKKLYQAVIQNHRMEVQQLISQGVSLVAPCQDKSIADKTLLDIASKQGDIDMLVILLNQFYQYGFSIKILPLIQFKDTVANLPSCSLTDLVWLLTSSWRNSILTLLNSLSITLEKSITLKDIFSNLNGFSHEQKNYLLNAWDKNINKTSVLSTPEFQNPTNNPITIPKEIENEPKESKGFNMSGK